VVNEASLCEHNLGRSRDFLRGREGIKASKVGPMTCELSLRRRRRMTRENIVEMIVEKPGEKMGEERCESKMKHIRERKVH
jgi:hypothetical protein